jgi:hypothetical protein
MNLLLDTHAFLLSRALNLRRSGRQFRFFARETAPRQPPCQSNLRDSEDPWLPCATPQSRQSQSPLGTRQSIPKKPAARTPALPVDNVSIPKTVQSG